MATPPPEYKDLGKVCKDFFTKGFNYVNVLKVSVKAKTDNLIETNSNITHELEDQTAVADFEVKSTSACWGLTTMGKWNTKNLFTTRIDWQDKLVQGLKLSLEGQYNLDSAARLGKLGAMYKLQDLANFEIGGEGGDEANILVNGATVFGYSNFLAGYQLEFDTNDGVLKKNNITLGYVGNGWTLHSAMDNLETITSILHGKIGCDWEAAIQASYTSASEGGEADPEAPPESGGKFAFGVKRIVNPCTSFKAMIDSAKTLTTACEIQVCPGALVTICSQIDAAGAGKLGLGLEFAN